MKLTRRNYQIIAEELCASPEVLLESLELANHYGVRSMHIHGLGIPIEMELDRDVV